MHIVYASDERYAGVLGVSLYSLLETHSGMERLKVTILDHHIPQESRRALDRVAGQFGRRLDFVPVSFPPELRIGTLDCRRWSLAAFSRLFAASLLGEADRILYLDCDTVICKSLEALFAFDMKGRSCAAVAEPMSRWHKANIGLARESPYFNSGVLLVDLAQWRRGQIERQFIRYIQARHGNIPYIDQGVLNAVLGGAMAPLPVAYNMMTLFYDFSYEHIERIRADRMLYPREEFEKALQDPAIVHFTASFKSDRPWVKADGHCQSRLWNGCLRKAGWTGALPAPENPGSGRRLARFIVKNMPGQVGILSTYLASSIFQPMIEK